MKSCPSKSREQAILFLVSLFLLGSSVTFAREPFQLCQLLLSSLLDHDLSPIQSIQVKDGPLMHRDVKYLIPKGRAPRDGWPVVFMFQGSFSPVKFDRKPMDLMGIQYEVQLAQQLLKEGFAVVAPRAIAGLGWQTNLLVARVDYKLTLDYQLFNNLLDEIDQGHLGPLNSKLLFATGISSGGYNTSRMGITFPDRFRALAIQAGSYATCLGPVCFIPDKLPKSHPPTLLIAGERDYVVPLDTIQEYHNRLQSNKIQSLMHINPQGEHGWYEESPELIIEWFKSYL